MYDSPTYYDALTDLDKVAHEKCAPASTMTLRDYFAAKAMQALIACASKGVCDKDGDMDFSGLYSTISDDAYIFADTMMKIRDVP